MDENYPQKQDFTGDIESGSLYVNEKMGNCMDLYVLIL